MNAQAFINDEIQDLGGQQYLNNTSPETVMTTLMGLMLPKHNSRFRVAMTEQLYRWASFLYGPETLNHIEMILNRGVVKGDDADLDVQSKSPSYAQAPWSHLYEDGGLILTPRAA